MANYRRAFERSVPQLPVSQGAEPAVPPQEPASPLEHAPVVSTTFTLSAQLNEDLSKMSLMLEGVEAYWDWSKNRLLLEALQHELARLERVHGPLPRSGRRLRRGRRPGGPARREDSAKVSARLPKELDGRLKDAVLFLRKRGQSTTKNQFVEEATRRFLGRLSQEVLEKLERP